MHLSWLPGLQLSESHLLFHPGGDFCDLLYCPLEDDKNKALSCLYLSIYLGLQLRFVKPDVLTGKKKQLTLLLHGEALQFCPPFISLFKQV